MRKIALTLALGALAALTFGAGAKDTIVKAHKQFEAAMNKNDFDAAKKVVRANFAPTFKVKTAQGEQNLQQFIDNVAPPGGKVASFHFELGAIKEKGNTATVTVTVHFKGSQKGKDGKPMTASGIEKDVETWTKGKNGWKMTSMAEIAMPKAHRT